MAKKIARPRLFKDNEEWWMEYEGHATNELCISPNGLWACAIFRLQEKTQLLLTRMGVTELKFTIAVPLVFGVSDAGVAAIVEFAEGGEKRLTFYFPDGAVGKTEPIKELQQTDRIFFDKKFAEVNLLSAGRILYTYNFGELEATINSNSFIYRRNEWLPVLIGGAILFVLLVAAGVHYLLK